MRIGYARVSTTEQHVERQQQILQELGAEKTFVDVCSGKNTDRPALKEMLDFIRADDIVIVESISRLARCTKDLLWLIDTFIELGVGFISQKEALDLSSDTGRFMVTIFGAISELERSFILARQAEGIAIAKANGVYKGRKPKACPDFEKLYSQVQRKEMTATQAWTILGLSKSSWYKRVRERQQSQPNPQRWNSCRC